jgi:hypothetical protein
MTDSIRMSRLWLIIDLKSRYLLAFEKRKGSRSRRRCRSLLLFNSCVCYWVNIDSSGREAMFIHRKLPNTKMIFRV